MDFAAAIDWVQAFPMLASIRDLIAAVIRLLPWVGTGVLVWVVLDPVRGNAFLATVREWLKGTKTVATELDAKVDARMDAIESKLDALTEAIKTKVPA